MKKILFIAAHRPGRTPSQRFRFEQYLKFFEQNGFQYRLSYIITETDDKLLYKRGHYFEKFIILLKGAWVRYKDVLHANDYDIVFVHREALLTGSTYFEERFHKSKAKMIFDFDDSIFLADTSEANKRFEWLKNPGKITHIIGMADMVFAGNQYLADYASRYNKNVKIMPTTIDTNEYKRNTEIKHNGKICIGWTGSITTIKHFEYAVPFLRKLKDKYGDRLEIKVIGDDKYEHKWLGVKGIAWSAKDEINELSSFDIGIMPLPNDDWTKGKCGLKGLQYMALEVPPVMSPVGVNTDIIKDGVNGFLAGSQDEWIDKISRLIESPDLCEKMGKEARKTIVERYSTDAQKGNYLKYFNELLK